MEYTATAKYVKTSTRKIRLVADAVRKLRASDALNRLLLMSKPTTIPLARVMASAIANAKQHNIDALVLRIKQIEVMGGPVLKRWRAVSRGTAHAYKKRMTHIRIVLTDDEIKNQKSNIKDTKEK